MDTECDMCMSKALLIEGNPVDDLLDEHEDGPGVRGEQMQTQPGVVQQAQDHQAARDSDERNQENPKFKCEKNKLRLFHVI